jgi:class 3 adenylate cyclase
MADKRYSRKNDESYLRMAMESADFNAHFSDLARYADNDFLEATKERFRALVGKEGKYKDKETIGTHPDFLHLENTDDIENHYAVSMFVDIKNSTSIYLKTDDLIWTKTFKNTVLRIITTFMQVFDGHVHRLQGDAVFGYFVWKDKDKEDAVIDALNAASFLLYYIENGLNQELERLGYDSLKLRIGIDFGNTEEVIWSEYGLSPATEVTTTSLHTDLAAKLQNRASGNSIMIGDNIKELLDLPEEFIDIKTYQENYEEKEDRYILDKPEKRYKMWVFKHRSYLKYFPFLESNSFRMTCIADSERYSPNISALPKGKSLTFEVSRPLTVSQRGTNNIRFEWKKENRGREAEEAGQSGKLPANETRGNTAIEATAYRGHHIMLCKVKQNGRVQETLRFGIFIK